MKNSVYELAGEADRIFKEAVYLAQEDLKAKNIPLVYVNRDGKICRQVSATETVCKKSRRSKSNNSK